MNANRLLGTKQSAAANAAARQRVHAMLGDLGFGAPHPLWPGSEDTERFLETVHGRLTARYIDGGPRVRLGDWGGGFLAARFENDESARKFSAWGVGYSGKYNCHDCGPDGLRLWAEGLSVILGVPVNSMLAKRTAA